MTLDSVESPISEKSAEQTPPPAPPARNRFLEILLDPRSLQYLMTFGAGLLVLGFVVWMWAVGIFENKLAVATAMGAGTIGMLGGGWALLSWTRHQIAGKAVTLLACLVMPLNLWFYHSQKIMTLEGHLWMAGVVCCALYAASALVLRKVELVYVSVLGFTLTGLLILADERVRKLWEIAAPSTLMCIIGFICIHAERAFPPEGPFSRNRFGRAFFNSGLAVMSSGLLLLLGAQVAGWLYDPHLLRMGLLTERPDIADSRTLQFLALGLVLSGTYAYVYSNLVVLRSRAMLYAATATTLWAELIGLHLLAINIDEQVAIVLMALSGLAMLGVGRAFNPAAKLVEAARECGHAMLSLSCVAAMLMSISKLIVDRDSIQPLTLMMLATMTMLSLLAALLSNQTHWRRWYVVTAVIEGCLAALVMNALSTLSVWEKLELCSVCIGLVFLTAGHVGWYRERDSKLQEDWVGGLLFLGSIMASMPLVCAVLLQRSHQTPDWTALRTTNEIGILLVGLMLLGSGTLLKLRATTLAGTFTMLAYILSLAFFLRIPEKLQTVSIYMMLGGGGFFGGAVLLSIYRDWLIALPGKVERREGVFRVLNWR